MSLFSGPERYLGVDIANSAVKVVELENVKGRPKLITYGYLEQQNAILTSNTPEARASIVEALNRIQKEARTTTKNCIAALPSYTVFTSVIHVPEMPKKELAAAVQWEAKKFVPMPIEEMILDWKILQENETSSGYSANNPNEPQQMKELGEQGTAKIKSKEKKFLKILLTAAPKDLVQRYLEVFQEAKLNLVSLETESFALERSLIGNDKSPIILIDVGAVATTISVVVDSVPLINRSIDIGGRTITKAIANSLNIDMDRAEQFKRDFGLAHTGNAGGDQIPKRIEFMVQAVVDEVKYVLNLYQSQGGTQVEKIVLAGGSAWLPNFTQYLSSVLGYKVFIGDPWARVMYPMDLQPVLQQVGPRLAVATGLAMREISA